MRKSTKNYLKNYVGNELKELQAKRIYEKYHIVYDVTFTTTGTVTTGTGTTFITNINT